MADEHPGASVIGTDLSPVQSSWVPPNLEIYIDDCEEEEWLNGSGFDLVHLGDVSLFLRDAQALFNKAHR